MATNWRPGHSSDEDDGDDYTPIKADINNLPKRIQGTSNKETISVGPLHINNPGQSTRADDKSSTLSTAERYNPPEMTRTSSIESIGQMLRQAGIDPEVADDRNIKWQPQRFVRNPKRPSGLLVAGTTDLYLDDDFFLFRDANGDLLKQPSTCANLTLPSPKLLAPKVSYQDRNTGCVAVTSDAKTNPQDQFQKDVPELKSATKKTNAAPKGNKKPQKKSWTKLTLDAAPSNVCPYGPPGESGPSRRPRFN